VVQLDSSVGFIRKIRLTKCIPTREAEILMVSIFSFRSSVVAGCHSPARR
jgi:hypothetical protein